jgi:galactose oxidase
MEPEIFDPVTESWTTDVPMQVPRLYHSTALLLPDGRVWVAGTDGETRMEVYTPDYLLRGVRPVISDAPASVAYGQGFSVSLLEPVDISSTCFIRLSAVPHTFNMGQRHVALDITQTDPQSIDITAPDDPNLAPPGHYRLFVLDASKLPSVAPIIQLVYA